MEQAQDTIELGHYRVPVASSGEGEAVLFLHGFDGPQGGAFIQHLAHGRRVIAPTHPGFAGSVSHPDIHEMHNVVLFYLELLDRLDVAQVDLVGHSLGAMFAAEVAAMAPERVRHLVLANPLGLWVESAPLPDMLATGGSALARLLWANPESEAAASYQPAQFDRTCNWAAASNYLWPIPDRGLASRVHRISSPTLLLRGSDDRIVSRDYLRAFEDLLPHASVVELPDAGHLAMLEQPDAFVQAVRSFLDA